MDKPEVITAAYRWNLEESLKSQAWADPQANKKDGCLGLLKWIGGLLLFAILFSISIVIFTEWINSPGQLSNWKFWNEIPIGLRESSEYLFKLLALFLLVFGAFWINNSYISPWLNRKHVLKYFSKNPQAEVDLNISIDSDQLTWEYGDGRKTINKWEVYKKVKRTRGGFLFFMDNGYSWIPDHALKSEGDIAALSQMAKWNALQYEEHGQDFPGS